MKVKFKIQLLDLSKCVIILFYIYGFNTVEGISKALYILIYRAYKLEKMIAFAYSICQIKLKSSYSF